MIASVLGYFLAGWGLAGIILCGVSGCSGISWLWEAAPFLLGITIITVTWSSGKEATTT